MLLMFAKFADLVAYNLFGLEAETRLGESVHFFFYDTTKIIFLLSIMIFFISIIRSYFPPEKTKKLLSNYRKITGHIMASLLGGCDTILFLFFCTDFYWFCRIRYSIGNYIFIFNYFTNCK